MAKKVAVYLHHGKQTQKLSSHLHTHYVARTVLSTRSTRSNCNMAEVILHSKMKELV